MATEVGAWPPLPVSRCRCCARGGSNNRPMNHHRHQRHVMIAALLLTALVRVCCGSQAQSCSSDHTGLAEFALQSFMAKPFEPIRESREGLRSGSWSFQLGEPEMRHWFLHQVWMHHAIGEGFMVYAGTDSGIFSGYGISADDSIWYTERKAGDSSPTAYDWSLTLPVPSLPFERSTCASGTTCRYQSTAWGCAAASSCRNHTTPSGVTCPVEAPCKTERLNDGTWSVQSGTWLARKCTPGGTDGGGESNSTGSAAGLAQAIAICGHADCVDQSLTDDVGTIYSPLPPNGTAQQVSGCRDNDVRLYYHTNPNGVAHAFRWRFYDPSKLVRFLFQNLVKRCCCSGLPYREGYRGAGLVYGRFGTLVRQRIAGRRLVTAVYVRVQSGGGPHSNAHCD